MDTLRGNFGDHGSADEVALDSIGDDDSADDTGREPPPVVIGQDERRMQVRAYNHWAGLLKDRSYPSIEDLHPDDLPDFGPYAALLDFTCGMDNPAIPFLGAKLATECGAEGPVACLNDIPSRSLLTRITDHYMQILANQAPIGFEAEFVNQRGCTIMYRGILLPFSSDDDTIDFILGVINWKELADQQTTDELMLEIDQALESRPDLRHDDTPLTEWADGPVDGNGDVYELASPRSETSATLAWPEPDFGLPEEMPVSHGGLQVFSGDMALADWLASARELARAAQGSEDRSRHALYAAIGRAYDFALAAADHADEFVALVSEAGLTAQDRAPMTPVVKLVFGAHYDKTRLTEYASALSHAQRLGFGRGALVGYLTNAPGGLKGMVQAERQLRRDESGKNHALRDTPREALSRKLRLLAHQPIAGVATEGSEFTLLVARRLESGEVVVLGEVGDDMALLERASRHLLG